MRKKLRSIQLLIASAILLTGAFAAACSSDNDMEGVDIPENATPYITSVIEYMPAVGQFVNQMPEYEAGDTQADMNEKALAAIGNNAKGMVTLGGYGGYITVGFDHTIENKPGLCDFRVLGNAFYAVGTLEAGSCEPGIIMVAHDKNKNGRPDADEWYEIAGSSHNGQEAWLDDAAEAGNDVETYKDYEMTYYRPEVESKEATAEYIRWTDNKGNDQWKAKNTYHQQPYYPQWVSADKLTFKGTRLPQNGVDKKGEGDNYNLYKFGYGYADNASNMGDDSAIDISWAVDKSGKSVHLPGVDFIRVYTGVNQENGWIGENSTEIMGAEDLHLLDKTIESDKIKNK